MNVYNEEPIREELDAILAGSTKVVGAYQQAKLAHSSVFRSVMAPGPPGGPY